MFIVSLNQSIREIERVEQMFVSFHGALQGKDQKSCVHSDIHHNFSFN